MMSDTEAIVSLHDEAEIQTLVLNASKVCHISCLLEQTGMHEKITSL